MSIDSIVNSYDKKMWDKYTITPIGGSNVDKEEHFEIYKYQPTDTIFYFEVNGVDNILSEDYYHTEYKNTDYFVHKNLEGIFIRKGKQFKIKVKWTLSEREIHGEGNFMVVLYHKNRYYLKLLSKKNIPYDIIEQENDSIFYP